MNGDRPEASPNERIRLHYLPPGQVFASKEPTEVTAIVGSCVATCLWDADLGVGGMNHYLLPRHPHGALVSGRFGDAAFRLLLDAVLGLGSKIESLRATIVGGAWMGQAFRDRANYLGEQNVNITLRLLQPTRIPVVEQATGGDRGRKLAFRTDRGTTLIETL